MRLCTRLTWVLGLPGMVGVALQGPVWLAGWSGTITAETAVLLITALRYGLGWPLRIGAFALMTWLLARNTRRSLRQLRKSPSPTRPDRPSSHDVTARPQWWPGASSFSSSDSTSAGATKSSSSPDSTGWSAAGT